MEKAFIDLVAHVFTLDWAVTALPLSLLLSLFTARITAGLVFALFAVVVHHVGIIALPVLLAGDSASLAATFETAVPKLEPLSLAAEFVAYAFLIIVFALTRKDLARPLPTD